MVTERNALITGTSSGIGRKLLERLLQQGYTVYGISRTTSGLHHPSFHEICMDLTDIPALTDLIHTLVHVQKIPFQLLINNAGCGYYGLHETLNPAKIHELVTTNLEVPMMITNLLLRALKEQHGAIVNLSSITAEKSNAHGAAYGATKAGLTSFSTSLFEEARKYGVRVIVIEPDMTDTALYRNADFSCSMEEGCFLDPEDVAQAVMSALDTTAGYAKSILSPQFHRISRK